ncbi:hypothetical protein HZS_268 [Henneguya salminicola]|nr:hypothetical protein HZS_268 [Henneguya salminicola]
MNPKHLSESIAIISDDVREAARKIEEKTLDLSSNRCLTARSIHRQLPIQSPSSYKQKIEAFGQGRSGIWEKNDLTEIKSEVHKFFRLRLGRVANSEDHRIIMWILLMANNPGLIDRAFACTPSSFSQALLVMTYDLATSSFVSCVYEKRLFIFETLDRNYYATGQQMGSCQRPCDFEMRLKGGYFHWKQSNLRKLMKIRFSESNAKDFIRKISFLTLLKKDEIPIALNYFETIFV